MVIQITMHYLDLQFMLMLMNIQAFLYESVTMIIDQGSFSILSSYSAKNGGLHRKSVYQ